MGMIRASGDGVRFGPKCDKLGVSYFVQSVFGAHLGMECLFAIY